MPTFNERSIESVEQVQGRRFNLGHPLKFVGLNGVISAGFIGWGQFGSDLGAPRWRGQQRRQARGVARRAHHVLCTDGGLAACRHWVYGHVAKGVEAGWREIVTGKVYQRPGYCQCHSLPRSLSFAVYSN